MVPTNLQKRPIKNYYLYKAGINKLELHKKASSTKTVCSMVYFKTDWFQLLM